MSSQRGKQVREGGVEGEGGGKGTVKTYEEGTGEYDW